MSERTWTRRKILESRQFKTVAWEVYDFVIDEFPTVLIGGLAVAHYANPPVTIDADFLVDATVAQIEAYVEQEFMTGGWEAAKLYFPHRQKGLPQRGVRIRKRGIEVDLIATGSDSYLKSVVARGKRQGILVHVKNDDRVRVEVASVEDIIVMKTLVGRDKDQDDVVALQRADPILGIDWDYVNRKLEELF